MAFDTVLRGGLVVDGTGSPGRRADVGLLGDRILAVGDLSAAELRGVGRVLDVAGKVVAPGFIDPHGHSDASVFVDGALASHLRQGFTTQLSGNCGSTLAPITPSSRELVELELRPNAVVARWRSFPEYLESVDELELGPNVAFLVGHGTIRGSVLGSDAVRAGESELQTMADLVAEAIEAGAFGLSSGLIYPPGMHAPAAELQRLAAEAARRGALYATHMRNESAEVFDALEEALATLRSAGDGLRLQVSHLKAGARAVWGRGRELVDVLERARADGLDVAADQYPYTAAGTGLSVVLPASLLALGVGDAVAALADFEIRDRVRAAMASGETGWENAAADPGWASIRISMSPTHADWAGHSIAALAAELDRDPTDVAFDLLVDDGLETSIVLDCMDEADVRRILTIPWIAVCTDAEGRRSGHPVLDAGRPHPRTYGSAPRVLGHYVRDEGVLPLETAIAKLTSVPAGRLGLRDRGVIREGAMADLVVLDPGTVSDQATDLEPSRYPTGIDHVFVNGVAAVLDGEETGERPGRLLRFGS